MRVLTLALASAAQALLELIRALPQGEKNIQFAQGTATVNFSTKSREDG